MFFKNWYIFLAIHVILRYSCLHVVFIFLFVSCRVFCRILIIFLCYIKFIFVSYSYHIIISCPKLSDLKLLLKNSNPNRWFAGGQIGEKECAKHDAEPLINKSLITDFTHQNDRAIRPSNYHDQTTRDIAITSSYTQSLL